MVNTPLPLQCCSILALTVVTGMFPAGTGSIARAQTIYYVDGSCGDDAWAGLSPVCEQPDGPKRTIQAGIDAAQAGDTVLVADGTYTGQGNMDLDFGGKAITVRSETGPEDCIIDCEGEGRGFYFHSGEADTSVVDGFTIQNGYVTWESPGEGYGGGILCHERSPTITNCTITGSGMFANDGGGGGIACLGGSRATLIVADQANLSDVELAALAGITTPLAIAYIGLPPDKWGRLHVTANDSAGSLLTGVNQGIAGRDAGELHLQRRRMWR